MNLEQAKKQNLDVYTFSRTSVDLMALVTDMLVAQGRVVCQFEESVTVGDNTYVLLVVAATQLPGKGSAAAVKAQKTVRQFVQEQ